jgi:ABC-2 type transport system permease protein
VTGILDLAGLYRAQFKTTIAGQLQYRGALALWLLGLVLQPVVYLAVWAAVARSNGGAVDGFTAGDFAAYFLVTMLVNHATFTWIAWEFEQRVRHGTLSPLLLRPAHPIHKDIADNLTFKLLTFVVVLPASALLILAFRPTAAITVGSFAAFLPALALAMALRFAVEWTLALAAFWTTRVEPLNRLYFVFALFLSGQAVPLALLPGPVRLLADLLPFRWTVAFPVELLLGRLSPTQAAVGFAAQAGWLLAAVLLLRVVWARGLRRYGAVGA